MFEKYVKVRVCTLVHNWPYPCWYLEQGGPGEGGGALPYLNMVGNFCSIDPRFLHFLIPLCPFFMSNLILLIPSFCRKISLSISHLVPEIIWAKIGLIFHKHLSIDHFEAFDTNFLLDFQSYWPLFFFTVLRSFWRLIFTKPQIPLGPFFIVCWTPLPYIWWSPPPEEGSQWQYKEEDLVAHLSTPEHPTIYPWGGNNMAATSKKVWDAQLPQLIKTNINFYHVYQSVFISNVILLGIFKCPK